MAFLDNSGDIILDAVLTDAGRKRLARGDGTFKVTKYAFGDDEIDYGSYKPAHTSGSAYFDLEILQTPILEAFTNNRSSLKSRLISLTNNNLLFLPELVMNDIIEETQFSPNTSLSTNSFLVAVSSNTIDNLNDAVTNTGIPDVIKDKWINGTSLKNAQIRKYIRVDQGLNTTELDAGKQLSAELTEQQYMIQIDNRFGTITDVAPAGGNPSQGSPSFIDDDQIATYFVTMGVGQYVTYCATGPLENQGNNEAGANQDNEKIAGPRGTQLNFGILASTNLQNSTYLFDTLGQTGIGDGTNDYSVLNTTVKVTGVTTGNSIDIPVTFVRTTGTS